MKDDMYAVFWDNWPEEPPVWDQVFDVVQSNSAYEQFSTAVGLGELLEKPEDEDIQADRPMESYTIVCKNRSWARMVPFSYETVQDAKKPADFVGQTVGTWARGLNVTKEKFYAKFFNEGAKTAGNDVFNNTITGLVTDASGDKIYDSQPFFGTHTDRVGNSYTNHNASNSLSAANLQSTYLTYTTTNNRDERGEVVSIRPDVLLIPPALRFTAQVILNTAAIPGSMDNDINTMNSILTPMEWFYLTDTDSWFVGKLKMGLMATDREDVSIDFWMDEISKRYYASIFTRFGGAVSKWNFWYGSNLSTS